MLSVKLIMCWVQCSLLSCMHNSEMLIGAVQVIRSQYMCTGCVMSANAVRSFSELNCNASYAGWWLQCNSYHWSWSFSIHLFMCMIMVLTLFHLLATNLLVIAAHSRFPQMHVKFCRIRLYIPRTHISLFVTQPTSTMLIRGADDVAEMTSV